MIFSNVRDTQDVKMCKIIQQRQKSTISVGIIEYLVEILAYYNYKINKSKDQSVLSLKISCKFAH